MKRTALKRTSQIRRTPMRTNRRKPGTRRYLDATLDRLVSQVVRLRDGQCVLCGTTENLTCGHFYGRAHKAVRFCLVNCNALCFACNFHDNEDKSKYRTFMLKRYGVTRVEQLERDAKSSRKLTDEELAWLVEVMKVAVEGLKERRQRESIRLPDRHDAVLWLPV